MIKAIVAFVVLSAGAVVACSSPEKVPRPQEPAPQSVGASRLWSRRMPGLIADLSVSRDSSAVLVSVIPDPDDESSNRYMTLRLDAQGAETWRRESAYRIKAQDLSDDGKLAAVVDYNDTLHLLDAAGRKLWSVPASCRPMFVAKARQVLCYHDDDVTPSVAFDVYDLDGKKIFSYPVAADVLVLKVGGDRSVALATAGGQVTLLGPDFKPRWKRKVPGEILDLAVADGDAPWVAALYHTSREGQTLAMLAPDTGKTASEAKPGAHLEQIELTPDGSHLAGFGSNAEGQHLVILASQAGKDLRRVWSRSVKRVSDSSGQLTLGPTAAVVGVTDFNPGVTVGELVSFGFDGAIGWRIPIAAEDRSYLYARSRQPGTTVVAIGMDDATLSLWRTNP